MNTNALSIKPILLVAWMSNKHACQTATPADARLPPTRDSRRRATPADARLPPPRDSRRRATPAAARLPPPRDSCVFFLLPLLFFPRFFFSSPCSSVFFFVASIFSVLRDYFCRELSLEGLTEVASSCRCFLSSASFSTARLRSWARFYTRVTRYLDQSELFTSRFSQSDYSANFFRPITDHKTFAKAKPTRIRTILITVE